MTNTVNEIIIDDVVIPKKSRGIKRKLRNICKIREHEWEGFYHDEWLFLDCIKCEAKNIQHHLNEREMRAIANGWSPNRLYIDIDNAGNHWRTDHRGDIPHIAFGYLDFKELRAMDTWGRQDIKPV